MINSIIHTCMTEGDFVLHSGQKTHYLFDIMKLISNREFLIDFREFVKYDYFLVGIEFGGAILVANYTGYLGNFAIIRKEGTIYGKRKYFIVSENNLYNPIQYQIKDS